MKKCPYCNYEINDENTKFCTNCGKYISPNETPLYSYAMSSSGKSVDRGLLKARARDKISGKIGVLFVISLVIGLISGAFEILAPSYKYTVDNTVYQISYLAPLIAILVTAPFTYAMSRIYLGITNGYTPKIEDVFFTFRYDYVRVVITELLRALYIFLWSLLFIIPGIVKTYAYSMTHYVLCENPNLSPKEALRMSEDMMRGRKMECFVLSLSFLGWIILGICTFGILFIWLTPYINTTMAEFYNEIKPKTFSNNQNMF
jgi:uncharacterized membrane protein